MNIRRDDAVWRALGSPLRRRMLDWLRKGPLSTGELARRCPRLSRFAVMQHLGVLTDAELVLVERRGRERLNYLNVIPLRRIQERWVSRIAGGHADQLLQLQRLGEQPVSSGETTMNQAMTDEREILFRLDIRAPRERVWQLLTDPALIPQWSYPKGARLDSLQVGGVYEFQGGDRGEILELKPPGRFVYRWQSDEPEPTVMEYTLEEVGPYTRLTLRNRPFQPGAEWDRFYEANFTGWLSYTLKLKTIAEQGVAA